MPVPLENATNLILHAWDQEWGPEETAKVLQIVGLDPDRVLAALKRAKAIVKAEK